MADCYTPGFGSFIGITWAQHRQTRNRAQGGQLLNRLVCGTIFTQTNAIMRKDVDSLEAHQCGQANRWTHIVREDQEGGTERNEAAIEGDAVHNAAHPMLTDAKVHVASVLCRPEVSQ